MQSKTSFFSRTLFFDLFKRFWPLFTSYLAILLIMLPLAMSNSFENFAQTTGSTLPPMLRAAHQVLSITRIGGVLLSAVFCIAIAMAAFGYLYNARSTSMMCSLPIKREGVFLTFFCSALCWLFIANLITMIVLAFVELSLGVLNIGFLVQAFAMLCLFNVFFFGFASLCATLTGHVFVLPVLYIILNFAAVVVEVLVRNVLSLFVYGLSTSSTMVFSAFSPLVEILASYNIDYVSPASQGAGEIAATITGINNASFPLLIIYAAFGLMFAGLAMLLIKHRRMETAGDVVAISPLKPIFKYCLTFGSAIVIGATLFLIIVGDGAITNGLYSALSLLGFMLFGGFIGYFAAEMLLNKTLRVFAPRKWIGFCVSSIIIIVVLFSAEFDLWGYERNIPATEDIASVNVMSAGNFMEVSLPENIESARALHQTLIDRKSHYDNASDNFQTSMTINYFLKNDEVLTREYRISLSDDSMEANNLQDLLNTSEAIHFRNQTNIPVDEKYIQDSFVDVFDPDTMGYKTILLSPAEAVEFYETCLAPDLSDCLLGQVWLNQNFFHAQDYLNTVYACNVQINLSQRINENTSYNSLNLNPTIHSTRTLAWLRDKGINPLTAGEVEKNHPSDYQYFEKEITTSTNTYPVPATIID